MARAQLDAQPVLSRSAEARRLTELYELHGADILAFALRRASTREDAADVLADTFLVAWRRLAEVPAGPAARLWLYGVARRSLLNVRRSERRRTHLCERLREEVMAAMPPEHPGEGSGAVLETLAALPEGERELLMLVCWEGLRPAQAAAVLDISPVAARVRLHRARARMRDALEQREPSPGPLNHDLERSRDRALRDA